MADYCIEKLATDKYTKARDGGWMPAFGLNLKSYPKAQSDEAAIEHFKSTTSKCRTPRRLIKWAGVGYNVNKIVLATKESVVRD